MSKKTRQKAAKMTNRTTFRLYAPDAKAVMLAGDFNGWKPATLNQSVDRAGFWETFLDLPPGEYQYKFVVDGDWQHDPSCVDSACNSFGTLNSVVRVR